MAEDDVDFVVAAYRDDGQWSVVELPPKLGEDYDALVSSLARFPSEVGVLAFASVNDDFFVVLRRIGPHVRVVLSDPTAALDWPLAADVTDAIKSVDPFDDDELRPIGDLDLMNDLGYSSAELELLCTDDDLYPDEALADISARLGFGREFESIVG